MTTPNESPQPRPLNPEAFTGPEAISAFVTYAMIAFEAHGSEFLDDTHDPLVPTYGISDIPYDAEATPHLAPFRSVSIGAMDMSEGGDVTHIEFNFDLSADGQPKGTVVRGLTLWQSGEIDDELRDYSRGDTADPDEPTKPASYSREDIRAYMDYSLGKEALRETLNEMEGLPRLTKRLTIGEIQDLMKLLPQ